MFLDVVGREHITTTTERRLIHIAIRTDTADSQCQVEVIDSLRFTQLENLPKRLFGDFDDGCFDDGCFGVAHRNIDGTGGSWASGTGL